MDKEDGILIYLASSLIISLLFFNVYLSWSILNKVQRIEKIEIQRESAHLELILKEAEKERMQFKFHTEKDEDIDLSSIEN